MLADQAQALELGRIQPGDTLRRHAAGSIVGLISHFRDVSHARHVMPNTPSSLNTHNLR